MILIAFMFVLGTCQGDLPVNRKQSEHNQVFNQHLYKNVLDQKLCSEEIQYLVKNDTNTLLKFIDAGIRLPREVMESNFYSVDLGNYDQCLGIRREISTSTITGKYCTIELPLLRFRAFPDFFKLDSLKFMLNSRNNSLSHDDQKLLIQYEHIRIHTGLTQRKNPFVSTLNVAVCIPKTCTTRQFIREVAGIDPEKFASEYTDLYCRLPNDKLWVVADYIALSSFLLLLLLVAISTFYDVYQTVILKNAPDTLNLVYKSFSIYTNSHQLMTYRSVPGTIECLDGVRAISMIWVFACHTYQNQLADNLVNPIELLLWLASPAGLWVAMSMISVDTFFLMSGVLLVYSTLRNTTSSRFIRNLPTFYINRITRILPVMGTMVLLQASLLNHIFDGPDWTVAIKEVEKCRKYWWINLLFIQNWVTPNDMCMVNTWYLAVDMQLYVLSPFVLIWVIGKRKSIAWLVLLAALLMSVVGAAAYIFNMKLPASSIALARLSESTIYMRQYYVNTLTRSSPFIIGMIYGYILHLHRNDGLRMSKIQVVISWSASLLTLCCIIWINYLVIQIDWDNQTVDSLVNSFMRPAWALAIGWIVVACHHGYGGPINWFLSLRSFKVVSRLSFAMYVIHYPLVYLVNSSRRSVAFFSPAASALKLLNDLSLVFIVAYIVTMAVDAPCTNVVKWLLNRSAGTKTLQPKEKSSHSNN